MCLCVCVCVRVITNQFPRVLSAVSSVCVWSVGGRESSWNSGWNPRSLLVSSLSANQIKQKRVSKNKLSRTRTCLRPHPAALLYIRVCVFVSQSVGYFHISFSQKNRKRIAECCGFKNNVMFYYITKYLYLPGAIRSCHFLGSISVSLSLNCLVSFSIITSSTVIMYINYHAAL